MGTLSSHKLNPDENSGTSCRGRILVVDDHPVVRDGLIRLINQQKDLICCGEAGSVKECLAAVGKHQPDMVIVDLRLKGGDGFELIKSIKSLFPKVRVLVLSQFEAPMYVERALRAGALGYVVKEQASADVLSAIRAVLGGQVYLTQGMASLLLHKLVSTSGKPAREGIEALTDREIHVLQLLGNGLSTRATAAELSISFKTVETHRENIKRKLSLRDSAELIHFASQWAQRHVAFSPQEILPTLEGGSGSRPAPPQP